MFSSNTTLSDPHRFDSATAITLASAFRTPMREAEGSRMGLLTRVLNELDYGLMIVSDAGRVGLANQAALQECQPAQTMQIQDGHVEPREERERSAFARALAASRLERRSMLTLHSLQDTVSLAVVPIGEVAELGDAFGALLAFGKRQACETLSMEFFARDHELTTAEGRVLKSLCNGLKPAQIARDADVAVSTIRTHIANLRLKTGATTIGELVRRLTMLPPIVPALHKSYWAADCFAQALDA
jgi:DNA-binding CsgD family transcriptional regulator